YKAVNLSILQNLAENKNITEITFDVLKDNGIISKNDLVKVLGNGELKTKINVSAHKFSASAKASIEAQGGTCSEI
ncbi:MAG: uL15 family ribosomal protein, partial [Bacteroidota bacterium]